MLVDVYIYLLRFGGEGNKRGLLSGFLMMFLLHSRALAQLNAYTHRDVHKIFIFFVD